MDTDLTDLVKVRELREDKALGAVRVCREAVAQQEDALRQALEALQRAHDEWAAFERHLQELVESGDCDATSVVAGLARITAKSREIEAKEAAVRKARQTLAGAQQKLAQARKAHQTAQAAHEKAVVQQAESSRIEATRVELAADGEMEEAAELLSRHPSTTKALAS
jgi:RNA polymerase-interacting CarD/CdnL/TRCF family regulator